MNTPGWIAALLCACLGSSAVQAASSAPELIEGVALRLPERIEAYRELHRITPLSHSISYRAPDGTPIARKWLDYACSDAAPAFEQEDLRSGKRLGGSWSEGRYRLAYGDRSKLVRASEELVASSGFDRFVRQHWQALQQGDKVELDFALPARLQTFRLAIARMPADSAPDRQLLWLRIVPAQALLRMFVAPIELAYDEAQQLKVYRGLSNLSDANGKGMDVEIHYRNVEADPLVTSAGELAQHASGDASACPRRG
jgi:hypothetical protein